MRRTQQLRHSLEYLHANTSVRAARENGGSRRARHGHSNNYIPRTSELILAQDWGFRNRKTKKGGTGGGDVLVGWVDVAGCNAVNIQAGRRDLGICGLQLTWRSANKPSHDADIAA